MGGKNADIRIPMQRVQKKVCPHTIDHRKEKNEVSQVQKHEGNTAHHRILFANLKKVLTT